MNVKKTPLKKSQINRLINVFDINDEIIEAYFIELEGTPIVKIEVKHKDYEESIYPNADDYDLIKNGIKLTRDAN